jgi:hypothetical protein
MDCKAKGAGKGESESLKHSQERVRCKEVNDALLDLTSHPYISMTLSNIYYPDLRLSLIPVRYVHWHAGTSQMFLSKSQKIPAVNDPKGKIAACYEV